MMLMILIKRHLTLLTVNVIPTLIFSRCQRYIVSYLDWCFHFTTVEAKIYQDGAYIKDYLNYPYHNLKPMKNWKVVKYNKNIDI
jgi:hypothetical protein